MRALRCDVSDGFYISIRRSVEEKRNSPLQLDLFGSNSDTKPIASKAIPWPSNEEAPTELLYSGKDGIVKLKNAVTVAEIPLNLESLNVSKEDGGCRRFKSFASSVPDTDSSALITTVLKFIEKPTSKTEWKNLKNLLSSSDVATLPSREQDLLLQAVAEAKESKQFEDICSIISSSSLFGYRRRQEFSIFCITNGLIDLVVDGLGKQQYSEEVKVQLLIHLASLEQELCLPLLEKLLLSGFSAGSMVAAAKAITPDVSSTLLSRLTQIYSDSSKIDLHSQALSLISALIDSTGSQLVLEKEAHGTLVDLMEIVTDFAALSDVFAQFEVSAKKPVNFELDTLFRLRRLTLRPRKLTW